MQWLACHRAVNRDDRVRTQRGSAERQSDDRARLRLRWRDRESWGLATQRAGNESAECNRDIDAELHELLMYGDVPLKLTYGTAASDRGSLGWSASLGEPGFYFMPCPRGTRR